jgi:hypothetical protein
MASERGLCIAGYEGRAKGRLSKKERRKKNEICSQLLI